jgi:hypothetical protein
VPAGEGDRERDAVRVGDQVVLGAGAAPVHRARARCDPPFRAPREEPTAQRRKSGFPAAHGSASRNSCRAGHTLAAVQSRCRRQQVTPPEQPRTLRGRWFRAIPVLSTKVIPASAARSSARLRPGYRYRRTGRGSSGLARSRSESGTSSSIPGRSVPDACKPYQPGTPSSFRNDFQALAAA